MKCVFYIFNEKIPSEKWSPPSWNLRIPIFIPVMIFVIITPHAHKRQRACKSRISKILLFDFDGQLLCVCIYYQNFKKCNKTDLLF